MHKHCILILGLSAQRQKCWPYLFWSSSPKALFFWALLHLQPATSSKIQDVSQVAFFVVETVTSSEDEIYSHIDESGRSDLSLPSIDLSLCCTTSERMETRLGAYVSHD
jgi:hypothetical protein